MKTSETITALAAALAKAQALVKGALKDAQNPHFKSKYADLASIWEACREALTSNGLSVVQGGAEVTPAVAGGSVVIHTRLIHSSGQWIESCLSAPMQQANAQGVGSTVTYLRRYALAAMVGVAPDDDDGEASVGRGIQTKVTATGKTVREKVDVVTGEVKTKRPEWSAEQTKEAGVLRNDIAELGGAEGDKNVRAIWEKYKYSAPSDAIDALATELRRWQEIAHQSVTEEGG